MRAAFYTLGCKVNQYETQVMTDAFVRGGFEIVDSEESADLYVVNSCTVTESGDKKTRQMLRRFKRRNPAAAVALCGCYPQAFPEQAAEIREADIIIGTLGRDRLYELAGRFLAGEGRQISILPHQKGERFEPMSADRFSERTRAYLKIEDGCDCSCAYCIIPTARGPVRSRPVEEVELQLKRLAQSGYREVVLLGINLSSYGREIGSSLTEAVELACSVEGIERVRLGSLEPELLSDEDIRRLSIQPKFCPQFHLSLQSGCDGTLGRMRRRYNSAQYAAVAERIRESFENPAITTDVMVGFPGESEEEFAASMAFVERIGFAKCHVFSYSCRPGTDAARMPDQLSGAVKAQRSRRMIERAEGVRAEFLRGQVGRTARVLFETREDGMWRGYSENYTPVFVSSDAPLAGQILPVTLTGLYPGGDGCRGEILSPD